MLNRKTIGLFILFFGGLIALWVADYAGVSPEWDARRAEGLILPQLIDTRPEHVRRVEISGGKPGPVAFVRREGGRWQMVEPVDALADSGRVEALVAGLKKLRLSLDAGTVKGEAATYGLDRPRTVRVFGADGKGPIAALEVGDVLKGQDLRYVRTPGARGAELTDALLLSAIDLPAVDWREHSLFTLSAYESARFSVEGPGRDLQAARVAPGKWRIQRPIDVPADFAKVQGVLADLGALRVEAKDGGFVADDVSEGSLAAYGLDSPRITITLGGEDSRVASQTVQIGKRAPGKADRAYARRADQDDVVLVDAKALESLGRDPDALRSQRLADIDPARVEFLSIRSGDATHELARDTGSWAEVRREGGTLKVLGKADPQVVQALLARLETLETSQFLDPKSVPDAESGLERPQFVLEAWQADSDLSDAPHEFSAPKGDPAAVVILGRHDAAKKAVYARTPGDPAVLTVPDNFLEVLPTGPLAFRERTILAQDRGAFRRLAVRAGGREAVVEGPERSVGPNPFLDWRMTGPVAAPADPRAVARLAVLLSGLRAETLVAESGADPKAFGLDAPELSVTWTVRPTAAIQGTPATRTLSVGKPAPGRKGSRFASVGGNPLIFTIPAEAAEILGAELRDRRLLDFSAERVSRVVLRWPSRSIALERGPSPADQPPNTPPTWEPGPGADLSGFDLARVNPLLQTLSHLAATRFAQYNGPVSAATGLSPPAFAIQVILEGDPEPLELRLGANAPGDGRYATTAPGDSGPVAILPDAGWPAWITPPRRPDDLPTDVFQPPTP